MIWSDDLFRTRAGAAAVNTACQNPVVGSGLRWRISC